jgi:hypothetical protein
MSNQPDGLWLSAPVIGCVVCLVGQIRPPKAAITVIRGYAACADHADWIGFSEDIADRVQSRLSTERLRQQKEREEASDGNSEV